jgi:hypothetical protein
MMCIAELGWPVVLEVSGLSHDRIYQMTHPRSGRPAMTAAIALDRAMKAAGKEPLCILTHSQLSGARPEGNARRRPRVGRRQGFASLEGSPDDPDPDGPR